MLQGSAYGGQAIPCEQLWKEHDGFMRETPVAVIALLLCCCFLTPLCAEEWLLPDGRTMTTVDNSTPPVSGALRVPYPEANQVQNGNGQNSPQVVVPSAPSIAQLLGLLPDSSSISTVCPSGKLGEFTHGARCIGYYDSNGLVDILLNGVASTKPYDRTKELVHPGVDIVAEEGSPIYSIRDGVVVDVIGVETDRNWKSLGYMVIVEHSGTGDGQKYYSAYFHMNQKPSVSIGDSVVAGKTELGLVGHTGSAFGNHLHLEVRTFKDRFNPAWNNIYGKMTPESEKTFDEKTFEASWVDPLKFANP